MAIASELEPIMDCLSQERFVNAEVQELATRFEEARKRQQERVSNLSSDITTDGFKWELDKAYDLLSRFIENNMSALHDNPNIQGQLSAKLAVKHSSIKLEHLVHATIASELFACFGFATLAPYSLVLPDSDRIQRRKVAAQEYRSFVESPDSSDFNSWSKHTIHQLQVMFNATPLDPLFYSPQLCEILRKIWRLHLMAQTFYSTPAIISLESGDCLADCEEYSHIVSGRGSRVSLSVWPGFALNDGDEYIACKVVAAEREEGVNE